MNRIEEIKDRLNNFKTAPREGEAKGLPWDTIQAIGVWADNAPADVEYLLAKLEYAEKVLSSIAMETEEDENAPFDEDLIGSPQSVAVRALKAIREGEV